VKDVQSFRAEDQIEAVLASPSASSRRMYEFRGREESLPVVAERASLPSTAPRTHRSNPGLPGNVLLAVTGFAGRLPQHIGQGCFARHALASWYAGMKGCLFSVRLLLMAPWSIAGLRKALAYHDIILRRAIRFGQVIGLQAPGIKPIHFP
jgi:hypothetical protein